MHVEQHVELDEKLSLKEAHDRVTRLESEMKEEVGEISSILTHIESEPATIETSDGLVRAPGFEQPPATGEGRHFLKSWTCTTSCSNGLADGSTCRCTAP